MLCDQRMATDAATQRVHIGRGVRNEGPAVGNDEQEFRDFAAARSRALLRTAYLLTGDHQHAEDLLQTALTKVFLAWGRIRDSAAVESYARKTLVTTYTSWWRRRSWHEQPVEGFTESQLADPVAELVERDSMWQAMQALPRQQRAVVVLRFYDDLSVDETARLLGVDPGTVKSHTSRALAALRVRLDSEAPNEAPNGAPIPERERR